MFFLNNWRKWLNGAFGSSKNVRRRPIRSNCFRPECLVLEDRITPVGMTYYTVTGFTDGTGSVLGGTGTSGNPFQYANLRGAVIAADANDATAGNLSTITLPAGTYQLTIMGNSAPGGPANDFNGAVGDLNVDNSGLTITGAGMNSTIIKQTSLNDRVFDVNENYLPTFNFTVMDLTIEGGRDTDGQGGGGGAIYSGAAVSGLVDVEGVRFLNDDDVNPDNATATIGGGAILTQGGSLTVNDSSFGDGTAGDANTTSNIGGAIYFDPFGVSGSVLTVTNSTFDDNSAAGSSPSSGGGAIYIDGGTGSSATISGSTFEDDQATGAQSYGGAIETAATTNSVTYCRFIGNSDASGDGTSLDDLSEVTSITANDNWWGTDAGPGTGTNLGNNEGGPAITDSDWLDLKLSASPSTIQTGASSTLTASFLSDSSNHTISASNLTALVGLTVTWTSGSLGSLSGQQTTIQSAGTATATFTAGATGGTDTATADVDGGTAASTNITIDNAAPTLTSISPNNTLVGSGNTTITLTGTNFVTTSTVKFNGTSIATTFNSATSLTAVIPSSDLIAAGTEPITVVSPSPGGGTSGSRTFTINNPVPTLTSISPNNTLVGSGNTTITATGTNFVSTSTVDFNGTPLATTYVGSTSLTAVIPSADLTTGSTDSITVVNPAPGGGTSGGQTFTVGTPVDLSISKTDNVGGSSIAPSTGTAVPGLTAITYTIIVHGDSTTPVTGVSVTDTFPTGLTNVTYTSSSTGTVTGNTTSGSVNIADTGISMSAGATITYVVSGTVAASAIGTLSNTATVAVGGNFDDTNPSNNSATDSDTLTPENHVSITKVDNDGGSSITSTIGAVVPGNTVTYTIVVSNSGPSTATSIAVSDPLPAGVTSFTWSGTDGSSGTGPVSDTIASLAPGSPVTYTVTAAIDPSATGANTVVATVPVGSDPEGDAYDATNGDLYVANEGDNNVSVIKGSTNTVVATVSVGTEPVGVAFDATNGDVYVTNFGGYVVSVINGSTNALVTTVPVGSEPIGVAFDATNGDVYVANADGGTVSVIDGSTNTVVATVPVGNIPDAVAFDATNGDVYVANFDGNNVSVINGSNTVVTTVNVGIDPAGMAFDATNGAVYVANFGGNVVSVINGSNTVVATFLVGTRVPVRLHLTPRTGAVYVANNGSNSVERDRREHQHHRRHGPRGRSGPDALAFDATNGDVYVANFSSSYS